MASSSSASSSAGAAAAAAAASHAQCPVIVVEEEADGRGCEHSTFPPDAASVGVRANLAPRLWRRQLRFRHQPNGTPVSTPVHLFLDLHVCLPLPASAHCECFSLPPADTAPPQKILLMTRKGRGLDAKSLLPLNTERGRIYQRWLAWARSPQLQLPAAAEPSAAVEAGPGAAFAPTPTPSAASAASAPDPSSLPYPHVLLFVQPLPTSGNATHLGLHRTIRDPTPTATSSVFPIDSAPHNNSLVFGTTVAYTFLCNYPFHITVRDQLQRRINIETTRAGGAVSAASSAAAAAAAAAAPGASPDHHFPPQQHLLPHHDAHPQCLDLGWIQQPSLMDPAAPQPAAPLPQFQLSLSPPPLESPNLPASEGASLLHLSRQAQGWSSSLDSPPHGPSIPRDDGPAGHGSAAGAGAGAGAITGAASHSPANLGLAHAPFCSSHCHCSQRVTDLEQRVRALERMLVQHQ